MLSTNIAQAISGVDELINASDSDFAQSGLKEDTLVRLTRIATVTDSLFTGTIGEIDPERIARLKKNLVRWIDNS
jgi:mRNA interferase MazF